MLARVKKLETTSTAAIRYVSHVVTDFDWVQDISNCIVFIGLVKNTTLTSDVFENTDNVFRIGNNSAFALTLSSTGNTFTLTPYEFATVRYVSGWVYVCGIQN